MSNVNTYFEGKVTSIAFKEPEGSATVGVMLPGEYEFSTSAEEHMSIISGELIVQLPGMADWRSYKNNETFIVKAKSTFLVKVPVETVYVCRYR